MENFRKLWGGQFMSENYSASKRFHVGNVAKEFFANRKIKWIGILIALSLSLFSYEMKAQFVHTVLAMKGINAGVQQDSYNKTYTKFNATANISQSAADDNGNLYVAGTCKFNYQNYSVYSNKFLEFFTSPSGELTQFYPSDAVNATTNDVFLAKYDSTGTLLWIRRMGSIYTNETVSGLTVSGSSVYISGTFSQKMDFNQNYTGSTNYIVAQGSTDMFLARYTDAGIFVWAKRGGGDGNDDSAIITASGNDIYVMGSFSGTANFNTPYNASTNAINTGTHYIVKYNSQGTLQWVKSLTADQLTLTQIQVVGSDIYASGYFNNYVNFNNTIYASQGIDGFLTKYDNSGNESSIKIYGGLGDQKVSSFYANGNNIHLAGTFTNQIFAGITTLTTSAQEYFIFKTALDGTEVWAKKNENASNVPANTDEMNSLAVNENGDAYLYCKLNPSKLFIVKYNSNGLFQWVENIFYANNAGNATDIHVKGKRIYITGNYGSAINFGSSMPGGASIGLLVSYNGNQDYFFTVMRDCPAVASPIAADPQTYCTGAKVTDLTAEGNLIKWYNISTGGTALTNQLATNGIYYVTQTIDGCENLNRLPIQAQLGSNNTVAPTGNASQSICGLVNPTLANLTLTGKNLKWYIASVGGTVLPLSTVISTGQKYYASQTVNGCESSGRFEVTVSNSSSVTAPTGTASQSFCTTMTIADLQATGTNIKWYAAASGGTALAGTTTLSNGSSYYASQTLNGCEGTSRLQVTVSIGNVAAPTGNSSVSICNSATVADLTATGINIQWYAAASGGTALSPSTSLTTGTTYYASQTVNGCESVNRLAKTVTILTAPQAPTGSANQSFCSGATIANLVATGSNIKWYTTSTGGSAEYSFTPLINNTVYYASQTTGSCESANRLAVTVSFSGPAAPTGSANQTFCLGSTVANLTATGTNIKWYSTASGGTALTSLTALSNGTTYYASQTVSTCESASRFAVTVSLSGTAAPTGSANQSLCPGSYLIDLNATGTNIKWYSAASGGTNLSTGTLLVNGNTYYASQTLNGCESVNRFAVTVSISTPPAPTGNANQSLCPGSNITNLSATGTSIKWYSVPNGGIMLSANSILVNGNTYYASQTVNGCESTNRFAVTVNLANGTAAPTGNSVQTFCNASTVASLVATGTNILWYSAASGGSPLLTTVTLVNGTTYYASQNNGTCESSSRLAVLVNIGAAAPTGSANQTVCAGTKLSDLAVVGTNIKWYTSAWPITLLSGNTTIVSGSTYTATQTISGCESTGLNITVTIGSITAPTGSANQSFNAEATVANLVASGNNIKWYSGSTGGSALASNTTLINGTTYYASQSVGSCESTGRLAVTVSIISCTPPTGSANQSLCSGSTLANLVVTGNNIKWYNSSMGGSTLNTSTTLVNGQTYYASQTVNTCESSRLAVTITLNTSPKPTVNNLSQFFCDGAKVSDLQATGSNIKWYLNNTGAAVNPQSLLTTNFYYASQTIGGCESTQREMVSANVGAPVTAPQGAANQTFACGSSVASIATNASTAKWYSNATGGNALADNTPLIDGTTYYASQAIPVWLNVNNCESSSRLAVTVKVNPSEYIDNHLWCGNFIWAADGKTYTSSNNTASVTIPNGSHLGCDSVVKLNLTIKSINPNVSIVNGYELVAEESNASSYIWQDCQNGNWFFDQAQKNFLPPYDGTFKVSMTFGSCSTESGCNTVINTGINQYNISGVTAYPTITNDIVNIKTSNDFIGTTYIVTDEIGKTIAEGIISDETTIISLDAFEEGFYIIRINKNTQVFKVVKRDIF